MKKEIEMGKRNETIDILKGFACLAVVILHCPFPTKIGSILSIYTRFAVPLFFIISGYFCRFSVYSSDLAKLKKKISHVLRILTAGLLLYGIVGVCINGGLSVEGITSIEVLDWVFFNAVPQNIFPYGGHLWFLFALLYCYPLYYLLNKVFKGSNFLYTIAGVLIIFRYVYAVLIEISIIPGKECFYTNVWLVGLPFFVIGVCIREMQLLKKISASTKYKVLFFVGGGISTFVEWNLFGGAHALFLGTLMILVAMMSYALNHENCDNRILRIFCIIGNRYSLTIYVVHMAYLALMNILVDDLFIGGNWYVKMLYLMCKPVIVISASVITAVIIDLVKRVVQEEKYAKC